MAVSSRGWARRGKASAGTPRLPTLSLLRGGNGEGEEQPVEQTLGLVPEKLSLRGLRIEMLEMSRGPSEVKTWGFCAELE